MPHPMKVGVGGGVLSAGRIAATQARPALRVPVTPHAAGLRLTRSGCVVRWPVCIADPMTNPPPKRSRSGCRSWWER